MKGELQKWVSSGVFWSQLTGLGKFYFSLLLSLDLDSLPEVGVFE